MFKNMFKGGIDMTENYVLARRLIYALYVSDQLFISTAKELHINPTELYVLYSLDNNEFLSQKETSEKMCIPLSTVNTIVKKWEKSGLIVQSPIEGKRREMQISLTQKGKEYARECLKKIYEIHCEAMSKTLEQYPREFIDAIEFFNNCQIEKYKKD